MHEITIFAALDWERRTVTAALAGLESAGPPRTWWGRLGDGVTCLVVQTGMGPARAAAAAAATPRTGLMMVCGCAGGLVPWLGTGDLVVADGVVDVDGAGRAGELLPARADMAQWSARAGFRVHTGPLASSATVLGTAAAKAEAAASGIAVDMESAAIAREALRRGVPFVGVRVVLDEAGDTLPDGLDVIDEDTGELRMGRALVALARRPALWGAARRLARQSRVAERRLRALLAALAREGGSRVLVADAVARAAAG